MKIVVLLSRRYQITIFIVFFLFSVSLLSCGTGIRTRSIFGGKLNVTVEISDKANLDTPVALDLVLVHDEQLLTELLKLNAKKWFNQKEQIMRDYIKGKDLDCWSWEWVPGQKIPVQKLPLKPSAEAGILFANYLPPGAHRVRFNPFEDILIRLDEKDFSVKLDD